MAAAVPVAAGVDVVAAAAVVAMALGLSTSLAVEAMQGRELARTVVAGLLLSARPPHPRTASMLPSSSMLVKAAAMGDRARTAHNCSRAVMGAVVTTSTTAAGKARTAEAGAGTRARAGLEAMVAVAAVLVATTAAVGVDTMPASSNVAGAAATIVFSVASRPRGGGSRPRHPATMDTRAAAMVNNSSRVAMVASSRVMASKATASPRMVSSSTASSRATAGARMARRRRTIRAAAQVLLRVGVPMVAVATATAAAAVVVAAVGTTVAPGEGTATTLSGPRPRWAGVAPWRGQRRSCYGEVAAVVGVGGSNSGIVWCAIEQAKLARVLPCFLRTSTRQCNLSGRHNFRHVPFKMEIDFRPTVRAWSSVETWPFEQSQGARGAQRG